MAQNEISIFLHFVQGAAERAERRAKEICPYEVIPPNDTAAIEKLLAEQAANKMTGHLGGYGVDCKKVKYLN